MGLKAWLLPAIALPLAAQTVTVEGTVANSITHEPISGVTIRFFGERAGREGETDASGAFRLKDVAPGRYRVMLTVSGFSAERITVQIDGGADPPALHLTMVPWPGLRGRVLDEPRQPVARAGVSARRWGNQTIAATTDRNGFFTFRRLEPGEYVLEARPPSAPEPTEPTELAPTFFPNVTDREQATVIRLTPGNDLSGYDIVLQRVPVFRISGKVVDERGDPAAGVKVEFATANTTATSGPDGAFDLPRVRPGDYYAFAIKEGSFNPPDMQYPDYAGRVLAGAPSLRVEENGTATLTLLYVKLPQ